MESVGRVGGRCAEQVGCKITSPAFVVPESVRGSASGRHAGRERLGAVGWRRWRRRRRRRVQGGVGPTLVGDRSRCREVGGERFDDGSAEMPDRLVMVVGTVGFVGGWRPESPAPRARAGLGLPAGAVDGGGSHGGVPAAPQVRRCGTWREAGGEIGGRVVAGGPGDAGGGETLGPGGEGGVGAGGVEAVAFGARSSARVRRWASRPAAPMFGIELKGGPFGAGGRRDGR